MHVEGLLAPETEAAVRTEYEALVPAAKTVVREVTKAMSFDRDEYERRVTPAVVETTREALFASLLEVHVGTAEEFESFRAEHDELDVTVRGSEHVDGVVWHVALVTDDVVAATFQDEEAAAVATLRRQAFGSVYRDVL